MTIRRYHVEMAVAAGTGILGLIAITGAMQLGHGWSETGPEAGYFPFYIGLILLGASLWNLISALVLSRRTVTVDDATNTFTEPFLNRESASRLGVFIGGIFVFVLLMLFLGIYVGSTIYITWSAWRRGGYRLPVSLAIGVIFAILLYIIFEIAFQMPLLKGPIESLLGIY